MSPDSTLLFVNKTAKSKRLSRSCRQEKALIFSHVQKPLVKRLPLPSANVDNFSRKTSCRKCISPEHGLGSTSDAYCANNSSSKASCPEESETSHPGSPSRRFSIDREAPSAPLRAAFVDIRSLCSLSASPDNSPSYRDQILSLYVETQTSGVRHQKGIEDLMPLIWLVSLPSLTGTGPAIDYSLLALSSAGLARQNNDAQLLRSSSSAYGRALVSLQREVSNTAKLVTDETMCACLILILCQLFHGQDGHHDWMTHTSGMAAILRTRQPASFRSGLAHKLFLVCRSHIILKALFEQKRTFLADQVWLTQPWTEQPKSGYESMIDCLSKLTALRELVRDCGEVDRHELLSKCNDTIFQCLKLRSELLSWFRDLPAAIKHTAMVTTTLSVSSQMTPFPGSYQFDSLVSASMLIMFWTCLAEIYLILGGTYDNWTRSQTVNQKLDHSVSNYDQSTISVCAAQAARLSARKFAKQICMSVQYFWQDSVCSVGHHYVLYPVTIANQCFATELPEAADELSWANGVLELIAEKGLNLSTKLALA